MKRQPILMKRIKKEYKQGKLIVGITGTHQNVGVTHLGLMLATYLSEWLGHRTAYVEVMDKQPSSLDIVRLKSYFYGEEKSEEEEAYTVHRVTFYPQKNSKNLVDIMNDSYQCLILDFGSDWKNINEFLRCDIKIVVSSLAVWKKHKLTNFLTVAEQLKSSDTWIYALPFTAEKNIKAASKEFGKSMYGVPYEPDPFLLSQDMIHFFRKFI